MWRAWIVASLVCSLGIGCAVQDRPPVSPEMVRIGTTSIEVVHKRPSFEQASCVAWNSQLPREEALVEVIFRGQDVYYIPVEVHRCDYESLLISVLLNGRRFMQPILGTQGWLVYCGASENALPVRTQTL